MNQRNLLIEFEELLKELPATVGYYIDKIDNSKDDVNFVKAKTSWWSWQKKMDEFIKKIDRDVRKEVKKSREHSPTAKSREAIPPNLKRKMEAEDNEF